MLWVIFVIFMLSGVVLAALFISLYMFRDNLPDGGSNPTGNEYLRASNEPIAAEYQMQKQSL